MYVYKMMKRNLFRLGCHSAQVYIKSEPRNHSLRGWPPSSVEVTPTCLLT